MPDDESDDDFVPPPSAVKQLLIRLGERPWEIFTILGTAVFVLGWAGILYIVFFASDDTGFGQVVSGAQGKIYYMVSAGPLVVIASGILWGVAAYTRRRSSLAD